MSEINCKQSDKEKIETKIAAADVQGQLEEATENLLDSKKNDEPAERATNEKDVYAYLDRDDFTAEKFKIEVRGLPKFYGMGEFRKFLNEKLQLNASKIKTPKRGSGWAYICFRSDDCRTKAIAVLNGAHWKKSRLTATIAAPAPDPYIKRKLERKEECSNKKLKLQSEAETLSPEDRIKSSTCPLWNMPYEDQLELKQKDMKDIIKKIGEEISKVNREAGKLLNDQKPRHNGLPCELGNIVHTDVIDGYRNKCEFTIGLDITSSKKIIGFRLSSYAAGSTAVGPIDDLCHIPLRMKTAIRILERFVQNSNLEVFDPVTHNGYWKQVTARTSRLNHLMLIIGIYSQSMSDEEKTKLKSDLKAFFEDADNAEANVTSLHFQTIEKKQVGGKGGGEIQHISGTPYIEEILLDMRFRISPEAFFQINSFGAEMLYKTAIDLAQPSEDTSLLDVCCGTGTIGLAFAKHCDEVLGIEMIPNAIKDAKVNAEENNITNCEFFVGKAEDVLIPVINRATKSNIIAVVDPPRAGLHQKAILALRRAKKLNKLVYISCDPKSAIRNLVDLARPSSKQFFCEPLLPVKAVPVDMFPYTKHCELVLILERFSSLKDKKIGNNELTTKEGV